MSSQYDVIVFGATGFTGGLVAEYLAGRESGGEPLRWAIAGRSPEKLARVKEKIAASAPGVGVIEARLGDRDSLLEMARQTRVVLTTVGPYDRYGEPVVEACVEAGADYVDITGEPGFVARIRERFDGPARERGLRIVNCCGFDSIPPDLGAYFTVRRLPADRPIALEGFVQGQGSFSGGTWQSAVEAMGKMGLGSGSKKRGPRPETPGRRVRPARTGVRYEKRFGDWVAPMPTIDPVIVLRSARALDEYGPDFSYGHYARIGSLPKLVGGAAALTGVFALAQLAPTRKLLLSLRKSGEGPDEETRARSRFSVTFVARSDGRELVTEVSGGDPGYGETSKMVAESALCLAHDRDALPERFGVLTPAVAMGESLLARLQAAGIAFEVVDDRGPGS